MSELTHVLVLAGGPGVEHSISWLSAHHVVSCLNKKRYKVTVVAISKQGTWYVCPNEGMGEVLNHSDGFFSLNDDYAQAQGWQQVMLIRHNEKGCLWYLDGSRFETLDVAIPMIHGTWGEDGSLQGFFEVAGLPYVGCTVAAMANTMNKITTKQLCEQHGLGVVPYLVASAHDDVVMMMQQSSLAYPVFVKAANQGSSFGVYLVENELQLSEALAKALVYSSSVLIETCIKGRELELAVYDVKDEVSSSSVFGEIIIKTSRFYTYDAKYRDADAVQTIVPASLTADEYNQGRAVAVKAYQAMRCRGFARVDCFLDAEGTWYVNEINGVPGFTSISLFPKLVQYDGLSMGSWFDQLIETTIRCFHLRKTSAKKNFRPAYELTLDSPPLVLA